MRDRIPPLGLLARILLIVAAAILAFQAAAVVVFFGFQRPKPPDEPKGFSGHVAALVLLLDAVTPARWDTVFAALPPEGPTATIVPALPPDLPAVTGMVRIETGIAAALRSAGVSGRTIRAVPDGAGEMRVFVELASGAFLSFRFADPVTVHLLGIPIGFFAGLLGIAVGVVALIAVARETKPLTRLAQELDARGTRLDPLPVPARGAREIRILVRAIGAMQGRIADLVNSRTLALGAISHDLRTSLTRLRLRLELMPDSPQCARAVADVETMQQLLEEALDFARVATAPRAPGGADLGALLREIVAERGRDAPISLEPMPPPPPVALSGTALRRVVKNLIDNALRYGNRADIRAWRDGDCVLLRVEDRGPGIPAEARVRVFEPFVRLETSRNRDSGGTGLGLTIVKQILDIHGGAVEIADRPGGGACVLVRLPIETGPAVTI
ncbi:ATP-binding protein [Aquabacter spiritensis]|uniref:histidine kinase n=1 Tax=Aquabacter spiritensis TaxID=933073 RepID=A0A4R3LUM5_9HYPH|nr:ATP-binding protein [Aquabacter spiritensis]TCT04253.1 signal transduction histidine kinase [Aquabacter spiritensis]